MNDQMKRKEKAFSPRVNNFPFMIKKLETFWNKLNGNKKVKNTDKMFHTKVLDDHRNAVFLKEKRKNLTNLSKKKKRKSNLRSFFFQIFYSDPLSDLIFFCELSIIFFFISSYFDFYEKIFFI